MCEIYISFYIRELILARQIYGIFSIIGYLYMIILCIFKHTSFIQIVIIT